MSTTTTDKMYPTEQDQEAAMRRFLPGLNPAVMVGVDMVHTPVGRFMVSYKGVWFFTEDPLFAGPLTAEAARAKVIAARDRLNDLLGEG